MIANLHGVLHSRSDGRIVIDVHGVGYEVQLPVIVEQELANVSIGDEVELVTLHYLQLDQTRGVPVLVGFISEGQREFFERLLSVPKVGPRLALQIMALPVAEIAEAIERGNGGVLQSLPGIGKQKARDIIAALQGKMARFALMRERTGEPAVAADVLLVAEGLLVQLGHSPAEAQRMLAAVLDDGETVDDPEKLVRLAYQKQRQRE